MKKTILLMLILLAASAFGAQSSETPVSKTPSKPEATANEDTTLAAPTFIVNPAQLPKKLHLIAYGDIRFMDTREKDASHPAERQAIVAKIAEEKPDALLISGDIPYRGAFKMDWEVMHAETKIWRDEKLRIYPALGNHELARGEKEGLENFWAEFPELNGKRWYSVEFGNVYIIALDSDTAEDPASPQRRWLEAQLSHLPKTSNFVILFDHHPPYTGSDNQHGHAARMGEMELGKYLQDTQAKIPQKILMISGHVHQYERFEHGGVTFIVSGGGGAQPYLYPPSKDDKYGHTQEPNFHYMDITVDGHDLQAKMMKLMSIGADGKGTFEEKDRVELKADAATEKKQAKSVKPARKKTKQESAK